MYTKILLSFRNSNVIVLALALYSLRLLGYSFIEKPEESLFFEVLKPFGNSLLMIAAMTYAKNNADIETMASLEGVMGGLYFGIGKALGSLVGGLAIEDIGVRNTFRCFSVTSLVTASVYFCFTFFMEKRVKMAGDTDSEENKVTNNEKENEPKEDISRKSSAVDLEDMSNKTPDNTRST